MMRLVLQELRHRPVRTAALASGVLVAAVSFVLLASAAKTSELRVRGAVSRNFRGAYDVLVRPKGSFTPLERSDGLVRDNYLSGIYGGITLRQYKTIERIPGVEVAAPIANLGYVMPFGEIPISIAGDLDRSPVQLYRLRLSWIANGGSRYPGGDLYVYYTRRNRFTRELETVPGGRRVPGQLEEVVEGKGRAPVCSGFQPPTGYGPFDLRQVTSLACFSARSPQLAKVNFEDRKVRPLGVGALATGYFPLAIAAIDPMQEAKLLGLDRTIVAGRYLRREEASRVRPIPGCNCFNRFVPVIASSRAYAGETLSVAVERLRPVVPVRRVPSVLAAGTCLSGDFPCSRELAAPKGVPYRNAYRYLSSLRGAVVGRKTIPLRSAYRALLTGGRIKGLNETSSDAYWQAGDVTYRRLAADRLEPLPAKNGIDVWRNPAMGLGNGGFFDAPQDNRDVQFRRIAEFPATDLDIGGVSGSPAFEVVGRYDPQKLPGFSPLSRLPLETYYPPKLEAADATTRRVLHGKPLLPTQNLGGYIQQPPLMLTTLQGLRALLDPQAFPNVRPAERAAPISVVRVRVAGVRGPDALSRARIRTVAQLIHDRTGLAVDITAGSSPHTLLVDLPRGRFGQPPLHVREGWIKKGVAVRFLEALDRKDLALFALILVVCGLFLANGAFAAARARRTEIGTLRTLGWSEGEIFRASLAELALVGLLAGLAGVGLAALLTEAFGLRLPLLETLLVLPIAVGLACAAGLVPAWSAARGLPLDAIRPPVRESERTLHARGLVTMALVNLRRLPGRALVGAAGLFVGVGALTTLIGIERGFEGTLVGTLLGQAITVHIRGVDLVAAGLTIALAAVSVADVLFLNVRERAAELVTLKTLGWSDREVAAVVGLEGVALGVVGSVAGAAAGLGFSALLLGVAVGPLAAAAGIAIGAGAAAAALASLLPLTQIRRLAPPAVLAAE
jgi:putative ABC transport system permease protein